MITSKNLILYPVPWNEQRVYTLKWMVWNRRMFPNWGWTNVKFRGTCTQRFPVFKPWFQRPSRLPLFKSGTYSRRDAQARCPTTTRFTKDVNSASVRPELDTLDLWMINNPTCHNISPISIIIITLMTFNMESCLSSRGQIFWSLNPIDLPWAFFQVSWGDL